MRLVRLFVFCIALAGCSSFGTQSDFQLGRQALLRGEPDNALTYFDRVTQSDATYSSYAGLLRESVWTYVGRAHYNAGRYPQALSAFDRALAQFNDEYIARLYRGLTLMHPSAPATSPARNPFSLQEVTFALKEGVEPRRVATLARERGVAFDLSRETETQLRNVGADTTLLDEIKKIRTDTTRSGKPTGDQLTQASNDVRTGLTGLSEWLIYVKANSLQGRYWDPGGDIQAKIKETSSLLAARSPNWDAVIVAGESVGYMFTDEPERARRDEQRDRQRSGR